MKCACGRTISANKSACLACTSSARKGGGVLEILNVQGGDVKITFDKDDAQDNIRARRIVTDMLRRGYALVVEVERDGVKKYERIKSFDEKAGEYIIADFDSLEAARVDAEQEVPQTVVDELSRPDALPRLAGTAEPKASRKQDPNDPTKCACGAKWRHQGLCKGTKRRTYRRLPMEITKATGIGRSAGG